MTIQWFVHLFADLIMLVFDKIGLECTLLVIILTCHVLSSHCPIGFLKDPLVKMVSR